MDHAGARRGPRPLGGGSSPQQSRRRAARSGLAPCPGARGRRPRCPGSPQAGQQRCTGERPLHLRGGARSPAPESSHHPSAHPASSHGQGRTEGGFSLGNPPAGPEQTSRRRGTAHLTLMMLLLRGVALAASSRHASGSGAAAGPRLPPGKRSAVPTAETPLRRSRLLPPAAAGASSAAGSGSSSAR